MAIPAVASTFHIKYDGEAISGGQIDARALADSLTSLSDVLERSNHIVNGRDSKIAIKVDGNMQPGSFIITIMTTVKAIGEMGSANTVEGFVNIAALIGFSVGTIGCVYKAGKTVIAFLKKKKGRAIEKIQETSDGLKDVTLEDGEIISSISAEVIEVAENQTVLLAMENMTKILNSVGIVSLDFWSDDGDGTEKITKTDLPSFKAPESSILLDREDERILVISNASLSGYTSGWRFKNDSDDIIDFQADIMDPSFLEKIKKREIVLKNGDMVKVKLQTQQSRPRRNLKTVYAVLHVIEFIPFEDVD
jgi:hypothetical protein